MVTPAEKLDPHKPLREDVRLLGDLLGETLRAHHGEQFVEAVERVRALAKARRAGDRVQSAELGELLSALDVEAATRMARAFSHFLNLANVAEQHHRIRRRRAYQREPGAAPQRGSCADTFSRLIEAGIAPDRLHGAVCALQIVLVLTAHPTEVSRRTMIHKYNRIAALLARRDRPDLTVPEQREVLDALRREISGAWASDEVRHEKLTPQDEVRAGLVVFEQSLWHAVPRFMRSVDEALVAATGQGLPLEAAPVRFGSWIGGDRDGNPNVTPAVTREACLLSRYLAADLYLAEIEQLRDELSMTDASPELREQVGDAREPYRELLRHVRSRLTATRAWADASRRAGHELQAQEPIYLEAADLAAPLLLCHSSLVATGHALIAGGRLTDILRRLAVFGTTMARLDIRQESTRHADALDAVTAALGLGSYNSWDERTRADFLARELENPRPLIPLGMDASPEVRDVLDTCAALTGIHHESLGAYVVTMTHQPSDVLAVELLQKEVGVARPLRVVPLFETSADLHRAPAVVDQLLGVAAHRVRIGGRQEVMVGYSDSAKDVGRFSASWDLFTAQEQIVGACRAHGVQVTLFHGRGGTVGRGGGPSYLALMSQPPGSIDGTLRVTEQGEMIQALFGLPDIAVRTMEVYVGGTLEGWLMPAAEPRPEWRTCMQRLRDDATGAYRQIVYETPAFIDYWRASTPVVELEHINIGSRPARRSSSPGIAALRAIPWQFGWTQTRLLVGSWLGIDEALARAFDRGEEQLLRDMFRDWVHFRSTVSLIEMALAKADAAIAAEYDRRLVPAPLQPSGDDLRRRLLDATAAVLRVTGHGELLQDNPVLRRSIDVRNPYVDPINVLQVELLHRMRSGDRDEQLRHAFLVTVNGIAAGLRNTG
jgi:phosphoenolpyruvate carboxylase